MAAFEWRGDGVTPPAKTAQQPGEQVPNVAFTVAGSDGPKQELGAGSTEIDQRDHRGAQRIDRSGVDGGDIQIVEQCIGESNG